MENTLNLLKDQLVIEPQRYCSDDRMVRKFAGLFHDLYKMRGISPLGIYPLCALIPDKPVCRQGEGRRDLCGPVRSQRGHCAHPHAVSRRINRPHGGLTIIRSA